MTNWFFIQKASVRRALWLTLPLGIASGLPLALTGGTLQAWATLEGLNLKTLGLMTLVGSAYTLKFLWAPLLDRYQIPFLGRRRGWLFLSQLLLAASLWLMSIFPPAQAVQTLALVAVMVAFLSASQDIVFDAWRTDALNVPQARSMGASLCQVGYRLGMVSSSGLALIIADQYLGFDGMYRFMALMMLLLSGATLLSPEPKMDPEAIPHTLQQAVWGPLQEFFSRPSAWAFLGFIVLYKLGDAFAAALSTTFLLREGGFSPTEVGSVHKIMGLIATIVGTLAGGLLLARWGLFKSLLVFGVLQAISNLGYWAIALVPNTFWLMVFAIGFENICGGLGAAAFVCLLMALCNHQFSATQYALLSALSAIGRTYLAGPLAPYVIESVGWAHFFLLTIVICIPGVVMVWWMRKWINAQDTQH